MLVYDMNLMIIINLEYDYTAYSSSIDIHSDDSDTHSYDIQALIVYHQLFQLILVSSEK